MSLTGNTSITTLPDGTRAFRKALAGAPEGFFTFEATGLAMLASLGARVPEVYEVCPQHLIMQVVEAQPGALPVTDSEAAFGAELAQLHLAGRAAAATDQQFGSLNGLSAWYLGAQPIDLTPAETLFDSLVVNRIIPLTRLAVTRGLLDPGANALVDRLVPEHLGVEEPPTVVHGDLWAGNRMVDASGASWLIDPSCHWGHREQDIAMMQLFGGFGPAVMNTYHEIFPLTEDWEHRVPVFQLVPLLVHVLVFGACYAGSTMRALRATVDR